MANHDGYWALVKQVDFETLYTVSKRWFIFVPFVIFPVTFFYDAPFGRFAVADSLITLDGIKSWIFMETVSPLSFAATLALHPFSRSSIPVSFPPAPQTLIAGLYFIHYLNRALISPLRTPSRSPSHPSVVFSALFFNIPNGFLLAAYISSATTAAYLRTAYASPRFWLGITLWAVGFIGNVVHDEILLNIRRKAISKGKAKEGSGPNKPHYAIPHGLLYSYISYPNYFCEWIEWLGFALAAAPSPLSALHLLPTASSVLHAATSLQIGHIGTLFAPFADAVHPPWAFLASEVLLMLPRAVRGHKWYKTKFGESYPRERWAVIPGVI
ncbi:hypothetical protein DENSPDRAFT_929942 [Dentipellis sp. KUC8613]|nr:hypothetical protein DENSPDRAFT_929942 [Dentipellis sp. KUC8613]